MAIVTKLTERVEALEAVMATNGELTERVEALETEVVELKRKLAAKTTSTKPKTD